MKKILTALVAVVAVCGVADAKSLVAYYSRSGNTEVLAREIASQLGADTYRIETADANWYPSDYKPTTEQAKKEIADGTLPPIKDIVNLAEYDTVFVGTPCWWGTMAVPVKTFLNQADLSNKTVVPFSTHGTSSDKTHDDIIAATPKSKHLDGLAVKGETAASSADAVTKWLESINITK